MKAKKILLLFGILIALMGCKSNNSKPILDELAGVWKTTAPQYADRFWEIKGNEIIFGTGGESFSAYKVFRVREVHREGKSWYTIYYTNPEGQEYGLSVYYKPGRDGGTIRFKNQQQMQWVREKREYIGAAR